MDPLGDGSEWAGLQFLGPKVLIALQKLYPHAVTFANSFEGEEDAHVLLVQLSSMAGVDFQTLEGEATRRLLEWSESQQSAFKRRKRMTVCNMEYNLFVSKPCPFSNSVDVFESIVKDEPRYALEVAKRVAKQRKATGSTRAELEAALRDKFALELAEIIMEACLPVVFQIEGLDNPNKAWTRLFGSRRGKTLRNRVRSWNRYRAWLVSYAGRVWPSSLADLVNYVEECISSGCSISLHDELQASLVLLERTGRVPEGSQLSLDSTWKAHLQSWSQELKSNGRPRGSAPPYSVAILISLELTVMDVEKSYYTRVIAWTMLMATWCCMRVDDVQCIMPESMRLSPRGFTVRLSRTKTTGPGKVHGQVHAFIHRSITLTGVDWLDEGMQLFRHESAEYPRDYLVPAPSRDWGTMRKKLVEPPQLANYFRMVLQSLGTPKFEDGKWRLNVRMELVPMDLSLYWTGHSARHFLPQVSAAIGCSKPDRDFLGRWSIGRVGANAYLHTSRQIIERIQQQSLRSFHGEGTPFDEGEMLDEIREFADKHNLSGQRVRRRHKTLPLSTAPDDLRYGFEEASDLEAEEDVVSSAAPASEDLLVQSYFITISRRTGFRRLHVVGKCHVHAERCQQAEIVECLDGTSFDAICRVCKSYLREQVNSDGSASSSSDGSSSSTSVNTSDGE